MANFLPVFVLITIILLIMDIVIRILYRRPQNPHHAPTTIFPSQIRALTRDLTVKLERVQDDFRNLEHQLTLQHVHDEEKEVGRMIDSMYSTFVRPGPRLAVCESPSLRRRRLSPLCDGYNTDALCTARMGSPFVTFCENLLAMNRIWKQQKQIKKLRSDLRSAEASRKKNVFDEFCNQLLLQNKVWRLEKQVVDLQIEEEKLKKRLEATVRRAGRKMMEELQHNREVEGYVNGMNAEIESYKLALGSKSALHEHELRAFMWEWCQEYGKLAREVDKLKLAQQAKSIQQDIQTDYEDSLHESLDAARRKAEELKARLEGDRPTVMEVPGDDSHNDDITHVDDDVASISSLTCVSASYDGRETRLSCRKGMQLARLKIHSTRSKRKEIPKPKRLIVGGDHTGFSFNPLFYGPNVSPLVLKARRPFDEPSHVSHVTRTTSPPTRSQITPKTTHGRWRI